MDGNYHTPEDSWPGIVVVVVVVVPTSMNEPPTTWILFLIISTKSSSSFYFWHLTSITDVRWRTEQTVRNCIYIYIYGCVQYCACASHRAVLYSGTILNRRDVHEYHTQFTQQGKPSTFQEQRQPKQRFLNGRRAEWQGQGKGREQTATGNATQDSKWKQIHSFLLHQKQKIIIIYKFLGTSAARPFCELFAMRVNFEENVWSRKSTLNQHDSTKSGSVLCKWIHSTRHSSNTHVTILRYRAES